MAVYAWIINLARKPKDGFKSYVGLDNGSLGEKLLHNSDCWSNQWKFIGCNVQRYDSSYIMLLFVCVNWLLIIFTSAMEISVFLVEGIACSWPGPTIMLICFTVAGTPYTQQSYKVSEQFPYKWINKKWKEGFHVTSMATAGNRWGVVMSRNSGYASQVIRIAWPFGHTESVPYVFAKKKESVPYAYCFKLHLLLMFAALDSCKHSDKYDWYLHQSFFLVANG
jgi:hypothetical protein